MSETDTDGGLFGRDFLLLALVLFVGVAGTGVVRRQLGLLGYNELGRYVFVLGYGGMVFVVWYGWIRPLDITGPVGNADGEAADDGGEAVGPEAGSADAADGARDGEAPDDGDGATGGASGRTER